MTRRAETDDRLDEVLAEIERARHEPTWVPEPERAPRRLIGPPAALEGARWTPSRPAVLVIVVVALLAASIVGVRLMLARPSAGEQVGATGAASARVLGAAQVAGAGRAAASGAASGVASGGAGVSASGTSGGVAPTPSPTALSVHVVGAVRHPGVVSVPAGSRVTDAVRAAGGLDGADATAINLARALVDGEQIHVPRPGEKLTPPPGANPATPSVTPPMPGTGATAAPTGGGTGAPINLNTADAAALDTLPGVGPVLAQRILDWRTANGRFTSVDELGEVAGIGDKALERLRPKVTV